MTFEPKNVIGCVRLKLYRSGENVRGCIYTEDHSSVVWNILTKGRMGENHLIGVDGEMSNITALRLILEAMGHGLKDFGWVAARPDRDRRYATHKCRISLQTFLLNQLRRINKSKDKTKESSNIKLANADIFEAGPLYY